jgi:hypothetical protein
MKPAKKTPNKNLKKVISTGGIADDEVRNFTNTVATAKQSSANAINIIPLYAMDFI